MYQITVQRAISKNTIMPSSIKLKRWAKAALAEKIPTAELTIRITDVAEITELNQTYRHKNKPTNVLSFPLEEIHNEVPLIGDIVICADVVNQEAHEQNKTLDAHWAHMVVHGVLHLLGHDHEKDHDADIMEALEIQILQSLGFANPYHIKIIEKGEKS